MRRQLVMIPGWGLVVLSLIVMGSFPRARRWVDSLYRDVPEIRPGVMLVAVPYQMLQPFDRTVILMLDYGPDRYFGVVVNRPPERPGEYLYWGGPVDPASRFTLFDEAPPGIDATEVVRGVHWTEGEMDWPDGARRVKTAAGYAGWARGQLEQEIALGAWMVREGRADLVFSSSPETIWAEAIGGSLRTAFVRP